MMTVASLLTDAVITRAIGAALSFIFLVGAWQKLTDRVVFQAALENYRLVPEAVLGTTALVLPLMELAAGALLLPASTQWTGTMLAVLLMLVVTSAVVINLLRGHTDIDCGCGGSYGHVGEQTLTWGLVVRNAVLIAALLLCLTEARSRELIWIDYLSVAGAMLAFLGLYVSANQLMANQPRLQSLRTGSHE
jgi:hypothetical protein